MTPLILFSLETSLVCTKVYHFHEYTHVKSFNNFVQSAVNARRQEDQNPNSGRIVQTMKLLTNSSFGYQFMVSSHHSVTRYINDEKTHAAVNIKRFK